MTIKYLDSKRIVGLSLTAGSEVGETSGTSESKTLGVTGSRYRGGIKIATGSALIGQTLSPTRGIKFELKRTGLSGVHSLSRFEIWNDTTIIANATTTFQPDSKVGTSYAYVEFFPDTTVTLQANDRITIATDGGVTNYYTFRSNSSGTYDTTKTHWTESTYNAGSGGTWTDSDTSIDGNFKFTLADVGDVKPTDVQDNSIMVEKDTARRYWFDADPETETESTGTYSSDVTTCSGDNDRNGFMVNSTSSAVYGKTINSVSFYLKKTGSPTGTAYVRVWSGSNSGSGTQVHEFGTIDVSTLTTSYVKYTFNTGSHTLAQYDTVGLQYSGSTSNAPVMQGATSDVYDGTNTIRNRFTSGAFSPVTSHDIRFAITSTTVISYNINNADTQQETRSGSTTSNGVQILSGNSAIGHKLSSIMFPLKKAGSPPNTFRFEVYNSAGTLQAQTPTSSANSLTTSFVDTTLTLTTPHTIVAGDRIVVTYGSGDVSNKILVSEDNSVGSIPSNTTHTAYNSSWSESTSQWSNAKFTSTSPTWTRQLPLPTYTYSSAGWTLGGSGGTVGSSNISLALDTDGSKGQVYYNILTGVSSSKFMLDFTLNFSRLTIGSNLFWFMGFTNKANWMATNTTNHMGICVKQESATKVFACSDGTSTWNGASEDAQTWVPTTSVDYHFRLTKLTSTTYKVELFSNSNRNDVISTSNGTVTSMTDLNHIMFCTDNDSGTGNATFTVSNLKFYNGVT